MHPDGLLLTGEGVNGYVMVALALFKYRLFKAGNLHGVGIELCFKTKTGALFNRLAALSKGRNSVEEVSAVELHTRKVGINVHGYARLSRLKGCKFAEAFAVRTEVVVVSSCKDKLLVIFIDTLADNMEIGEVERSTLYLGDIANRQTLGVSNGEMGCINL